MADLKLSKEPKLLVPGVQPTRTVIYGLPGAGKSQLGLTWPRPFVIDTNHGLEGGCIQGHEDVRAFQPDGHKDLSAIYFWIKSHTEDIDTIMFDDLTTLVRLLMNEVTDGETDPIGNYEIDMVPSLKNYLAEQKQIERILSDFRRLGKHIVVTAGVRQPTDEDGNPKGKRTPDVSPGILSVVRDWASLMGELVVMPLTDGKPDPKNGEPTRVLFTDPSSEKRECKTRWSALEPNVIDPTFPKMWNLISPEEVK